MFHIFYRTHEHKVFVDVHANFFHFLGIEHESAPQHHELGDEPFFFFCLTGILCCAQLCCIFNLNNNKYCVCFH